MLGKREELRSPASGRSGKREESTIQRRDRTSKEAAAAEAEMRTTTVVGQREEPDGTDGAQAASEKRPQPRGISGGFFLVLFRVESSIAEVDRVSDVSSN